MMRALIFGFMLLFAAGGIFQMALTVPMIQRRVKPNALYGFRVPKTLSDEQVWYDANAYAGRLVFASGAAQVLAAIVLVFVPGLRGNLGGYCLVCAAVTTVTLLLAVWLSNRYVNAL